VPASVPFPLIGWTGSRIAAECTVAYRAYERECAAGYRAYFAAHPELRAVHPFSAKNIEAALPEGWAQLGDHLPVADRHRWHLSGKSSQVLALGLLGVARELDASLRWLWAALSLDGTVAPPPGGVRPESCFEYTVEPELLGERPRQTSVDFFVDAPGALLCLEAKWTEEGIGACGCARDAGDPATATCSKRVLSREPYWNAAHAVLGLPPRVEGKPCPLSFTYQAARNIAAATALAKPGQRPVFALLYDERNPYFGGCGEWPGWPAVLRDAVAGTETSPGSACAFAAASWQHLVGAMPLDPATREWAVEKHGLDQAA
jgi:hypothetical protein